MTAECINNSFLDTLLVQSISPNERTVKIVAGEVREIREVVSINVGSPIAGDADLGHLLPLDEPVQGFRQCKRVVVQLDGVKVIELARGVQRPRDVVERHVQDNEVEAAADVEDSGQLVAVQEDIGER